MSQIIDKDVWGKDKFSERGAQYAWLPYWFEGSDTPVQEEEDVLYSHLLAPLLKIALDADKGAIFEFCAEPEDPNTLQTEPYWTA